MDDVMADTLAAQLEWLRRNLGGTLTKEDFNGKRWAEVLSEFEQKALDALLAEGSFFGGLPVMPGCQEVLREMNQRFEVFVATAAMEFPASCGPKYDWLRKHFPFLDKGRFVFCGDKSILNADYLIDDLTRNLRGFRGEGVLFTAPHNVDERGWKRVSNWDEIGEMFLGQPSHVALVR
jgi:5'(3')-deoxyribonucleotidase